MHGRPVLLNETIDMLMTCTNQVTITDSMSRVIAAHDDCAGPLVLSHHTGCDMRQGNTRERLLPFL
jgi:hypothetical protein